MKICEIIILYKDLCSRSIIIAMLSGKNILANLKIWCSKMQPFSGNQRPDPVTSLMNMSPVLNLPRKKKHLYRSSSKMFKIALVNTFYRILTSNVLRATATGTFWTAQLPKVLRARKVFNMLTSKSALGHKAVHVLNISTSKHAPKLVHLCILTSKCASRHNGVHFFDFSPSTSALRPRCFEHFDFQICFAPQPCAILYPPLLPKCLRTRRFSEPTSRPSGATKHWKNSVFRTFLPFRTLWSSFYWLFLSSDYTCP